MDFVQAYIAGLGGWAPVLCIGLFMAANLLVVWRLEVLSGQGVEGTVLGTLIMPCFSGMGNLVFALLLALQGGDGGDVLINCLFNNMTNMTLLIAGPVLIWSMAGIPRRKSQTALREFRMGRLSLSLNLMAALFFTLCVGLLAMDGVISRPDGFLLLSLFVFWQCFHVYDVKKTNLLKKKTYPRTLPLDLLLLLVGAVGIIIGIDGLVQWFEGLDPAQVPDQLLGWATGVLMVLPNALLAFYYGARDRMDVVYTSQSGDAHICIPLCIGLFAAFRAIPVGPMLQPSLLILMGLCLAHLLFLILFGRLPRVFAALFLAAFALFLWMGTTTR